MKKALLSLAILITLSFGAIAFQPDGDPPPGCLPIVGCP